MRTWANGTYNSHQIRYIKLYSNSKKLLCIYISGLATLSAMCHLQLESLTFFCTIVLRTFQRTTIICVVYSDLKIQIWQKNWNYLENNFVRYFSTTCDVDYNNKSVEMNISLTDLMN